MKVELMRKDSKGIKGTYANAEHHAQACIPLVKALETMAPTFGFEKWKQGHNVHLFVAKGGRKFDMVPYVVDGVYIGLQLRLRASRSSATPLVNITELDQVPMIAMFMKALASCEDNNERGQFLQ